LIFFFLFGLVFIIQFVSKVSKVLLC
jgi:hypothetical protein